MLNLHGWLTYTNRTNLTDRFEADHGLGAQSGVATLIWKLGPDSNGLNAESAVVPVKMLLVCSIILSVTLAQRDEFSFGPRDVSAIS